MIGGGLLSRLAMNTARADPVAYDSINRRKDDPSARLVRRGPDFVLP
jgi:hypothetical protein